jgi:predicted Zn-dependent protease with MMP-like domain
MHVSEGDFRRLVKAALGLLPAEFRPYLEGVPVVIAAWPPDTLLDELEVPEDDTLYGLYSGRALTDGPAESGELPPRITLFRGPLLEDCLDEDDLRDEIATTVLHEIAHHFGISDARLAELGWG